MLISLNGQVLELLQLVKKYGGLAALGSLGGLVSSDEPNGLMIQRNLVSHLSSPVLSQFPDLNGSSSQHTGVVSSVLFVFSGL